MSRIVDIESDERVTDGAALVSHSHGQVVHVGRLAVEYGERSDVAGVVDVELRRAGAGEREAQRAARARVGVHRLQYVASQHNRNTSNSTPNATLM